MRHNAGNLKWGIILILVGLVFLLHNYGFVDFWWLIGILWPLILIWWGYTMIRRSRAGSGEERAAKVFGDQSLTIDSDEIRQSTVFGDIRLTVSSSNFKGGSASAVFGDLFIDLGSVENFSSPASMRLETVFGDIVVRLPSHAAVELHTSRVFGTMTTPSGTHFHGNRYRSPDFDTAAQRIEIDISQVFGDLEIMKTG
jgi:predicted membrane protein